MGFDGTIDDLARIVSYQFVLRRGIFGVSRWLNQLSISFDYQGLAVWVETYCDALFRPQDY